MPPKTAIIIGPTAGGKSGLAVACALAFMHAASAPAAIISADSMLIYKGMDIGTAKPTVAQMRGVVHHLVDICEPSEPFTVRQWLLLAHEQIARLRAVNGWAIIVGGTHLYVKALLDGLFEGPGADAGVRARLHALPPAELRARLESHDPAAARKLHPNDLRRTVRALEVLELTGTRLSEHQVQWDTQGDAGLAADERVLIGLEWPTPLLNQRINARVREMVERGLVDEVKGLLASGRLGPQAAQALGYKQIIDALEGRCGLEEAIERIKVETRRFAKNQRTWAKRLRTTAHAMWIDASGAAQAGDEFEEGAAARIMAACRDDGREVQEGKDGLAGGFGAVGDDEGSNAEQRARGGLNDPEAT